LVTGGAGFIGSNFVRYVLARDRDVHVATYDSLTYAGNLANLESVRDHPRHRFDRGDITDAAAVAAVFDERPDAVVHFAAESHVDRSIDDSSPFVRTNVLGTGVLLEAARRARVRRFLHVSTDEVYGSIAPGERAAEDAPLRPTSPYAASKAASDLLALSYFRTHGVDVVVTRCSNNFGPYQFPEKVIPLFITNAIADQPLPLYGDGGNVRDWIYVDDHCAALAAVLERGRAGEVYNIGADNEWTNRELTSAILRELAKPVDLVRRVSDRPAHDRRYALDSAKIRGELGWRPEHSFETALARTVDWYARNRPWWSTVKSGDYRRFYDLWYGNRLMA
jgi:dTDP-glucose 4,6-dehydratase